MKNEDEQNAEERMDDEELRDEEFEPDHDSSSNSDWFKKNYLNDDFTEMFKEEIEL